MHCQVCAAELRPNARFCMQCGNSVDSSTSNIHFGCPVCKLNDKVSKVSALVEKHKYHIEGTRQTWASDEDGSGWSPAWYSETRISVLAQQLAAPVEPEKPHGVSAIIAVPLVGVLVFLFFCVMVGIDISIRSPQYAISWGIICCFMVAVFIILLSVLFRLDKKTHKETKDRYSIERPAWVGAMELWKNCYFCERDDIIFDAGTGRWCRRIEFKDFLFS